LAYIASLLHDAEMEGLASKAGGAAIALPPMLTQQAHISIHSDPSTGRQYTYDDRTGATEWLEGENAGDINMMHNEYHYHSSTGSAGHSHPQLDMVYSTSDASFHPQADAEYPG
jgi:hypothetical protein